MTKQHTNTDDGKSDNGESDKTTATAEPAKNPDLLDTAADVLPDELTRYKTDELKTRFDKLFGVAHFLPWAGLGLGGSMVGLLTTWAVLFVGQTGPVITVGTLLYMGLQGLFVGVIAAALLVIARVFQQLTAIIDISIQTLREALRDLRRLGDPSHRAELTGALIHGAVVPAVQSAVTVKLGLLRAPISFVLNRILKKTANRLTEGIRDKMVDADEEIPPATDDVPVPAKDDDSHLAKMHERIETIARRTRRATLIPAAVVFAVIAGVSSLPWVIAFVLLV